MRMFYKGLSGVPMADYTGERIRATNEELKSLAMAGRLFMACHHRLGEVMRPRLRMHPGAWQKWRSGVALLGRAMDVIYQTVPDDQFERLARIVDEGILRIDLPMSGCDSRGVVAVHADDLETIAYAAMHAECAICLREGGYIRKCALRKALQGVIEPDTWETTGCAYRDQILRDMEKA